MSNNSYVLSYDQKKFVSEASRKGLIVDYSYTNKFLHGETCPAVCVTHIKDFRTTTRAQWEKSPKGYIIYCPY